MPIVFGSQQANGVPYVDKDQRALIQAEIDKWGKIREQAIEAGSDTFANFALSKEVALCHELDKLEAQWADEIADVEGMPNYMTREELEGEW